MPMNDTSTPKPLLPNLTIQSGDTVYKVVSVYADNGDFRNLWESLIVGHLTAISGCNPG